MDVRVSRARTHVKTFYYHALYNRNRTHGVTPHLRSSTLHIDYNSSGANSSTKN